MAKQVDLKQILQREFIRRRKKNPKYSLRAYAKFLEVDQSFLSKVLNGTRVVTPKLNQKFSMRLGYSNLVPVKTRAKSNPFVQLNDDEFEVISSWLHFAILELLKVKKFKFEEAKAAQLLGCHVAEVKDAMARLERMGFVQRGEKSWVLVSKNHTWTQSETTTEARRKTQIELQNKSINALENIPFALRENGSLTVAVDSKRLPEFKKKLNQCLHELSEFMQPNSKNLDNVYQVTLALFPILQKSIQESENV